MSEQNVDIIRRSWSAWMERDMDRAAADWHPDVVWDITRHDDAPDTVHRGVAEVVYLRSYSDIEEGRRAAADGLTGA